MKKYFKYLFVSIPLVTLLLPISCDFGSREAVGSGQRNKVTYTEYGIGHGEETMRLIYPDGLKCVTFRRYSSGVSLSCNWELFNKKLSKGQNENN